MPAPGQVSRAAAVLALVVCLAASGWLVHLASGESLFDTPGDSTIHAIRLAGGVLAVAGFAAALFAERLMALVNTVAGLAVLVLVPDQFVLGGVAGTVALVDLVLVGLSLTRRT